jgi:ATP-dependent DNA helicase RecQ
MMMAKMDELERALREHFGFEQFRPNQREVIENVLARRHTLAVLPTGLGKSLCYQLPAQMMDGLTLVVSPLIALMQDQIDALVRRGFTNVTFLSSALSPSQIGHRYNEIERGAYKLVYVAPERCDSPRFQQLVRQRPISLVVIDEAHCISQWGHDFRPHYRTLLTRLPELRRATFLALTATATPDVQNDIEAALDLPGLVRIVADFNRPGLRFESIRVNQREEKDERLVELLSKDDGATIIYASTRKEAATVHQLLQARGIRNCLYHAGLDAAQRAAAQRSFLSDQHRIIVATVAFGLGIDKPNVQCVVHYNIPGSLENYYQEAGRAGRDGEPATCTLLYWQPDVRIQRFLLDQAYPEPQTLFRVYDLLRDAHPLAVAAGDLATASGLPEITVNAALQLLYEQQWLQMTAEGKYELSRDKGGDLKVETRAINERRWRANERLKKMIAYAAEDKCRREQILNYFGQKFAPPCSACDVCSTQATPRAPMPGPELIATEVSDRVARAILQTAADLGGRYGRTLVADLLAGSRRKRIVELGLDCSPHHGALRLHNQDRVLGWIDELIAQEKLKVTAEEYPRLLITGQGQHALAEASWLALSGFTRQQPAASIDEKSEAAPSESERPPQQTTLDELIARLKQWRRDKAISQSVSAFVILHDSSLHEIAERLPRNRAELAEIKGIGESKLAQFGEEILSIVREFRQEAAPRDLRLQIEIWRQGGDEPDIQALLDVLANPREAAHGDLVVVINVLSELGVKQSADAMLKLLGETSNGNLLMVISETLGTLGLQSAAVDLIGLLDDERPGVRRAAARGLGRLRAGAALEKLEMLAQSDATESVRLSAAAAAWLLKAGRSG